MEAVNIHAPVIDLCARLGLDPHTVSRLDLEPDRVTVHRYALNEQGKKYVDPATSEPARLAPATIKVRTTA